MRRRRQFKFPLETRTSRSEVLSFLTCHNILITLFWAAACFINVFYTLDTFISWLRTPYRVARKRRILSPRKDPPCKRPPLPLKKALSRLVSGLPRVHAACAPRIDYRKRLNVKDNDKI